MEAAAAIIFCGTSLARQGTLLDVVRSAWATDARAVIAAGASLTAGRAAAEMSCCWLQRCRSPLYGPSPAAASILEAARAVTYATGTTQSRRAGCSARSFRTQTAATGRSSPHRLTAAEGGQQRQRLPANASASRCSIRRAASVFIDPRMLLSAARTGGERRPERVRHGNGRSDVALGELRAEALPGTHWPGPRPGGARRRWRSQSDVGPLRARHERRAPSRRSSAMLAGAEIENAGSDRRRTSCASTRARRPRTGCAAAGSAA